MDKFSELKAAALAATPGPWNWKEDGGFYYLSPEGVNTPLERIIDDGSAWGEYGETIEHNSPDAHFIAAANPAAVLALLAELESAQQRSERLDAMLTESVEALKASEQTLEREREKSRRVMSENQQQAQRIAELERYAKERDAENESIAMTVGKLRAKLAELDSAQQHVAELEEEVAELRDMLAFPVQPPDDGRDDCIDMWPGNCADDFDTGYKFGLWRYEQNIRDAGFNVEGDA